MFYTICNRCIVEKPSLSQITMHNNSFQPQWLMHPSLKEWILKRNDQAFCKFCDKPVIGTLFHMLCHGESLDHKQAVNSGFSHQTQEIVTTSDAPEPESENKEIKIETSELE